MAGQTASAGFLPRLAFEHEYLGLVAATGHVLGAGTMATFTTLFRRPSFCIQRRLPVRRFLPSVVTLFVAGFASVSAHVLGNILGQIRRYSGGGHTGRGCARGWIFLRGGGRTGLARSKSDDDEKKQNRQKASNDAEREGDIPH